MNTSTFPSGFRYFSSAINLNKSTPAFNYSWNPTLTFNNGGVTPATGGWMPSQLDASGNLKVAVVGAVFSGTLQVDTNDLESIATSGIRSVTNNFSIITGSQLVIPVGSRSWSIGVISGEYLYINGTGAFPVGVSFSSTNYNANAIVLGGTGNSTAPFKAVVQWEV